MRVGGLTVTSGELLHGDVNGVTQMPLEIAAEVADIADEFIAAEGIVLEYVKGDGTKSIAEFSERSKAMSAAIQGLRQRVSRRAKS